MQRFPFVKKAMPALFFLFFAISARAGDWPQSFTGSDGASYTVYQPQVTGWAGNIFSAKAAVSVTPQGAAAPTFGTVEISAPALVDKPSGTVALQQASVTKAVFPGAPSQASAYAATVAAQATQWGASLSLSAIQANLAVTTSESGPSKTVPVANTPPVIYYSQGTAVLVLVDGEPALREVPGSKLLRVINTTSLLLMDKKNAAYYLRINGQWATAGALGGPWSVAANPPQSLASVLASVASEKNLQLFDPPAGSSGSPMPAVYVSTQPAELITTQGAPQFAPVPNTQLLYVTNSASSIFVDEATQQYFVVISGRWFRAASLTGSWEFVPADQLPAGFAKIPETHPAGKVLASVSGTTQSKEAGISATIPQTAQISRQATTSVNYAGGKAQFAPIENTSMAYAKNTATPVIQISPDKYYAVENGVWFVSPTPDGPWTVAESVPPAIYSMPPSSPVYYASNVYVYGSTPDYVTFGYTPAYFGSYLAPSGVVVFGTGFSYPPFIGGGVWIGPPLTFGFGAGFACGLATGFAFGLAVDHGWGCSPWWGPWHGGWGAANVNINRNWNNINVNRQNVYNRWGNNINVSNRQFNNNTINNAKNRNWENNVRNNDADRWNNWKQNHPDAAQNARQDADNWKQNHPDAAQNARQDADNWKQNHPDAAQNARQDADNWKQNHPDAAQNARQDADNWKQNHPDAAQNARQDADNWKQNHPDAAQNARQDLNRDSLARDDHFSGDNHLYAGNDGNVYRHASNEGGWERSDGSNWHSAHDDGGDVFHGLNSDRESRNLGGFRDAGGFHGGGFGGGGFHGGGRR